MKAILEYNLDNKDEAMAHLRAIKSLDMACVLFEIQKNLKRNMERTLETTVDIDAFEAVNLTFSRIYDLMADNNINLDELIE